jgi:hypothetical protein
MKEQYHAILSTQEIRVADKASQASTTQNKPKLVSILESQENKRRVEQYWQDKTGKCLACHAPLDSTENQYCEPCTRELLKYQPAPDEMLDTYINDYDNNDQ